MRVRVRWCICFSHLLLSPSFFRYRCHFSSLLRMLRVRRALKNAFISSLLLVHLKGSLVISLCLPAFSLLFICPPLIFIGVFFSILIRWIFHYICCFVSFFFSPLSLKGYTHFLRLLFLRSLLLHYATDSNVIYSIFCVVFNWLMDMLLCIDSIF